MSMVSHSVIIVISYTRLGAETQQSMNKIYLSYYAIDLAAYKLQHRNVMGICVILGVQEKLEGSTTLMLGSCRLVFERSHFSEV